MMTIKPVLKNYIMHIMECLSGADCFRIKGISEKKKHSISRLNDIIVTATKGTGSEIKQPESGRKTPDASFN